jgi:hypothetical protein
MSQFILFTNSGKIRQLENKYIVENIKEIVLNKLFIKNISQKLLCNDEFYTIADIHKLCSDAQYGILYGNETFENTNLYKILYAIKNEEIFLWYGSEIDDLDEVKTFNELIENIKESLQPGPGEIYIHYKRMV